MNKSYRGRRKSPIIEQEHFYMKKKILKFYEWMIWKNRKYFHLLLTDTEEQYI